MSVLRRLSSTQRSVVVTIAGFVISLFLVLLAEATLRVRAYISSGYVWGIEKTFTIDPESGLRILVPGGQFGAARINSLGFRSPDLDVPKPPGTLRIAFLGGSTTYCAEVSSHDLTWPYLVTKKLTEKFPHARIDYVNGGVPGYGIGASLRNLEHRIKPLEPDVIVIYHSTNDLSYNSFQLAVAQGVARQRSEKQLSWLSNYSLLVYLVEKNLMILEAKGVAESPVGKLEFETDALAAPFETALLELTEAGQEVGDLVALVTFSHHLRNEQTSAQKVRAAETSLYYMPYMSIDGLLEAFNSYNVTIRGIAHATDSLLIENELQIPGDPEHFVDSVHLSDAGSRVMADTVFDALVRSPKFQSLIRRTQDDGGDVAKEEAIGSTGN